MNIYDDYASYLDECTEIIKMMKTSNSPLLLIINDVMTVTDSIYTKYTKKQKLDEDTEEIFSLGFSYLSSVLSDIKTYYEDYFDKSIDKLNRYSSLIISLIMLNDFKDFLEVEDVMNDDLQKEIEELAFKIDGILANNKQYDEEILSEVEYLIDSNTSTLENTSFKPVYIVFALIREELELNESTNN